MTEAYGGTDMAITLIMDFAGVGQDKYEAAMKELGMEMGKRPDFEGGLMHIAGPSDNGWTVIDVWESQEHFDRFLADHLGPTSAKVGIPQPSVRVVPVYNSFGS